MAIPTLTHADPRRLAASLADGGRTPVEVRETHLSWVFLTPTRAYKLGRPVLLPFADMRDPAVRAEHARHELRLNADLAPGIGIAVRSVMPQDDGGYRLAPDGDRAAVDHVTEMHRFDEATTMRARLRRGTLTRAQTTAVGARLAAFHRSARRAAQPVDEHARFERNVAELLPLVTGERARDVRSLARFAHAFLTAWEPVLDARFAAGHVVEGHGDVRCEHVLLGDDGSVRIVDRLDIDRFGDVDVADELAFLTMDLEAHHGEPFVDAVLAGYVGAGGAAPPARLLAYCACYRGLVRAKVALLPGAEAGDEAAGRLVALARRNAWRARGDLLLLVAGPPGSGKSTLATALGGVSGLDVLQSDVVRRDGPPRDYGDAARAAVYGELASRADACRAAIVDATFGEPALREAFFDRVVTGEDRPVLVVECRAPEAVRIARSERRRREQPGSPSDAGPEQARSLGHRFSPVPGDRIAGRLTVDTTTDLADQVGAVEAWLDERLA